MRQVSDNADAGQGIFGHWEPRARSLVMLVLGIAALVDVTSAQSISDRAARDELAYMSKEEPAMREAFAKAKASLNGFLAKARDPSNRGGNYSIKVAVSDGKNTEYFWVRDFSNDGDRFSGVLDNQPRLVKKYRRGEKFAFHRDQVVDWMYIDQAQHRMVGNYTACALLSKEPPAQAKEFQRKYGLTCE